LKANGALLLTRDVDNSSPAETRLFLEARVEALSSDRRRLQAQVQALREENAHLRSLMNLGLECFAVNPS